MDSAKGCRRGRAKKTKMKILRGGPRRVANGDMLGTVGAGRGVMERLDQCWGAKRARSKKSRVGEREKKQGAAKTRKGALL